MTFYESILKGNNALQNAVEAYPKDNRVNTSYSQLFFASDNFMQTFVHFVNEFPNQVRDRFIYSTHFL
jgi:hypothetical protein